MSSYEEKILLILKKNKIFFEREKSFKDLHQGKYRFDFYIPNYKGAPAIIEVQGEQHYQFTKRFHKTRSDFLSGQFRDREKIGYCFIRNIPLYCIPYWEIENIKTMSDIINPRFRATSRYKNDFDWQRHSFS